MHRIICMNLKLSSRYQEFETNSILILSTKLFRGQLRRTKCHDKKKKTKIKIIVRFGPFKVRHGDGVGRGFGVLGSRSLVQGCHVLPGFRARGQWQRGGPIYIYLPAKILIEFYYGQVTLILLDLVFVRAFRNRTTITNAYEKERCAFFFSRI